MGSLKKILMTPVYALVGWFVAAAGERMYGALALDLEFDEEDLV